MSQCDDVTQVDNDNNNKDVWSHKNESQSQLHHELTQKHEPDSARKTSRSKWYSVCVCVCVCVCVSSPCTSAQKTGLHPLCCGRPHTLSPLPPLPRPLCM